MIQQNQGRPNEEATPIITGSRPQRDGPGGVSLYTKASILGAVLLFLNLAVLNALTVFDPAVYRVLTWENYPIESSTAFLFFLTALTLLAIAALGRGLPGRWLYPLGALVFLFAAGEELSWGQHIFGFESPGFFRDQNYQGEFNFHNLEGVRLYYVYSAVKLLLCAVTTAAYFARKPGFLGVPFPSILLIFCFFLVYAYPHAYGFSTLGFTLDHLLLLIFAAYAWFSKKWWLLALSALFLATLFLQRYFFDTYVEGRVPPNIWEGSEYLFSIACLVYAGELLLTHRAVVERNGRAALRRILWGRRLPGRARRG